MTVMTSASTAALLQCASTNEHSPPQHPRRRTVAAVCLCPSSTS
jgi:hypothetical protein